MGTFTDKITMQHRLFAELSSMFGREVPMYDKSLLVNKECNKVAAALFEKMYPGFSISDAQLDKAGGERHGAIRIGRPDEYRWVARFFNQFAMEPHNFYDMANVGNKSQPIIATAFRSVLNPEHRVFASLLLTDYFDAETRRRIESVLETRRVFSDRAKELIEKGEKQGGLDENDADDLIREATHRIFKWTGHAHDHSLYKDLCDAGFKIAADIACFESHHLNHLTPNTFSMDLFTAAMKFCMGELPEADFRRRAATTLTRLLSFADRDFMKLHFKHLARERIDALPKASPGPDAADIAALVDSLVTRLSQSDLQLARLEHAGFKDFTEGPAHDTPVLLRQDAYKALPEPVTFRNADGSVVETTHTARFGEIEQRFYATTPAGRELYDKCLMQNDAQRDRDLSIVKRDFSAFESQASGAFAPFPKTLRELVDKHIVYGRYAPTPKGLTANGAVQSTDMRDLVSQGFVQIEGLRHEDFLPVSAAGIFASNLNQYGTKATAAERPVYTKARLEEIMGKAIIESDAVYRGIQARSMLDTYAKLGLLAKLPAAQRTELESQAAAVPL